MSTSATPATSGPAVDAAVLAARGPGFVRLTRVHATTLFVETVRVPIAVIGTAVFPALTMLFFVVPTGAGDTVATATAATAQISLFAVMSVCLFTFGVGVAEDRALPWDAYLRTLPVGPGPRLVGRLLNGLLFAVMGLVPVVVLAALLTQAQLPLGRLAASLGAIVVAGVPMLGIGLTIGYALSTKAALAVAQVLLLPMAFLGGLFLPPQLLPDWLDTVSRALPTRAGRELLVSATAGTTPTAGTVLVLAAWTLAALAAAVWAYRRDEGRRFR